MCVCSIRKRDALSINREININYTIDMNNHLLNGQ